MVAEKQVKRCSHCGTCDTPLWRLGPQGAKTLCNACGLRWRKTGRFIDDEGAQHASKSGLSAAQKQQQMGARPPIAKKAKKAPGSSSAIGKAARPAASGVVGAAQHPHHHQSRSHRRRTGASAVQAVDVERCAVNDYLPPAAEDFRQAATRRTERVYTLDDFWPYYHNVFSGLMVVHKSR
mmetsp:Transcript_14267/g.30742  ORF Transcript_14267/g.30742 Transcript_14267/m.30742 type:complete len:180 (+) Transcript_14267:180-719(+)